MTDALPENYLDLIVSCEEPKSINDELEIYDYEPCGYCAACRKIINYDGFGRGFNQKYRKKVVDNALYILRNSDHEKWKYECDEVNLIERQTYTIEVPINRIEKEPEQLKLDLYFPYPDEKSEVSNLDNEDLLKKALK